MICLCWFVLQLNLLFMHPVIEFVHCKMWYWIRYKVICWQQLTLDRWTTYLAPFRLVADLLRRQVRTYKALLFRLSIVFIQIRLHIYNSGIRFVKSRDKPMASRSSADTIQKIATISRDHDIIPDITSRWSFNKLCFDVC